MLLFEYVIKTKKRKEKKSKTISLLRNITVQLQK
jgi:hypothetical protein